MTINVKPGWKAGTKVKFAGEGEELPNGQAQDIEFVIEEASHSRFTREGDNLRVQIDISLLEALTGFQRTVITLDGRNLRVSNHTVVKPDHELRFPNEGMPITKTGGKGDLVVQCKMQFPRVGTRLTDAEKEKIASALAL